MTRLAKALWYVLTLRCEEADRVRAVENAGGETAWSERVGERLHSSLCKSCRIARRKLDAITDALHSNRDRFGSGGDAVLSDAAKDAMAERLRVEQQKNS
jgi:hypothetical protein